LPERLVDLDRQPDAVVDGEIRDQLQLIHEGEDAVLLLAEGAAEIRADTWASDGDPDGSYEAEGYRTLRRTMVRSLQGAGRELDRPRRCTGRIRFGCPKGAIALACDEAFT
jgi:hypothetical protein